MFPRDLEEEFEDTKGVIRIRKSKDRQHKGQKKKDKQRSTKHTHKTKDRVTKTTLKTGGEFRYSGRVSSSCSTSGTHRRLITFQFPYYCQLILRVYILHFLII